MGQYTVYSSKCCLSTVWGAKLHPLFIEKTLTYLCFEVLALATTQQLLKHYTMDVSKYKLTLTYPLLVWPVALWAWDTILMGKDQKVLPARSLQLGHCESVGTWSSGTYIMASLKSPEI